MADFQDSSVLGSTASQGHAPSGDASGANGLMNKLRETATGQLAAQKDLATDRLGSVAQAVRQSTQGLRDQKQDAIANYVEQAADQIDKLTQSLRDKDVTELMTDVQRLAKKQPGLFIGGAFVLGLVGARFLKSSAQSEGDGAMHSRRDYGAPRFALGPGTGATRSDAWPGDVRATNPSGGASAAQFSGGTTAGEYGGTSTSIGNSDARPGASTGGAWPSASDRGPQTERR